MIYMLSYPRCGSSFVRYCVENLLKRPTLDCGGRRDQVYGDPIQYKSNIPILRKEHFIKGINTKVEKLILLVRNYKDSFISHNLRNLDLEKEVDVMYEKLSEAENFFAEYYNLLDYYDKFEKDKLIIYYDELIQEPQFSVQKILNFLEPGYKVQTDLEKLKNESQQKYKQRGGLKTEKIKHLHKIFTEEQNNELDMIFRENNEYLYDKYLSENIMGIK